MYSQINDVVISNDLGFYRNNSGNWRFVKKAPSESLLNLVSRRNNLMGSKLVTMIEVQKPFNVFDSSFKSLAKYHVENQTYEMRKEFISGLFFQLFTVLETKLNFTGLLMKRKDGKWGAKDFTKANGMFFLFTYCVGMTSILFMRKKGPCY